MPKKAIDYSKCVFYKIVCRDLAIKDLYVGHTTQFTKRKASHKTKCHNINSPSHHFKVYQFIRDNGGWTNWEMIEIEKRSCIDIQEATKIEREWVENLNANLNCQVPSRTKKEYALETKDRFKEAKKEYREENKELIKEYMSNYREINKDKIKEHKQKDYKNNKEAIIERVSKYANDNKEKIKEYHKIYYQNNKAKYQKKNENNLEDK